MRVQFSVNPSEWAKLERLAKKRGYPDVPSYCRDVALEERTYALLWEKVVEGVSKMSSGTTFALRDLVESPPANLGVKLYENQERLGIRVNPKKDSLNTNTFRKL